MAALRDNRFLAWLGPTASEKDHYRHVRLDEDPAHRAAGMEALQEAVATAHADATRWIADLVGDPLDPFTEMSVVSSYPQDLHTLTLQGYLGEVVTGVVAENFDPHGVRWQVPAFLFRFHTTAIESLDRRLLLGDSATRIPGRTGDDCVAFLRGTDGTIEAWLNCEAKCTAGHDAGLISKGHQQLSRPLRLAASGLQLIQVMQDSADPEAADWVAALRVYRNHAARSEAAVRADLFVYVCGRRPAGASWLPRDRPHWAYTAAHPVEAVEVHFEDIDVTLTTVYPGHVISRD
jgi:hypothetical protein